MMVDGDDLTSYMVLRYEEVSKSRILSELPSINKTDMLFGMQLLSEGIEKYFDLQLAEGEVSWSKMSLHITKHALEEPNADDN